MTIGAMFLSYSQPVGPVLPLMLNISPKVRLYIHRNHPTISRITDNDRFKLEKIMSDSRHASSVGLLVGLFRTINNNYDGSHCTVTRSD